MKEKFLPNQKYYTFSTECRCGVVVDEKTMKKIQKVLYKAEAEIKNILHNSQNVRPYEWSMVSINENGLIKKALYIKYPSFYLCDNVNERIDSLKLTTPTYESEFYEIHNKEELTELKNCLLKELREKEE